MKMKLETQNIIFSSDWHLFHNNVIKFDNRPFNDVHEMHDAIIKNWNNTTNKDSVVFYTGDLTFGSINKTKTVLSQLNPVKNIYCILGNHDKIKNIEKLDFFDGIFDLLELNILDSDVENPRLNGRQSITLCHYPIIIWDKHHHGAWHLHGHCHHNLVGTEFGDIYYKRKVIDLGTNGHHHTPLSYQDIKDIMGDKKIDLIDQI